MSRSGIQLSVPGKGGSPIDWAHLEKSTFGDRALAGEVLRLFVDQAAALGAALRMRSPGDPELVHKLKGSACGIGAVAVVDAAERLEAVVRTGGDPRPAAAELVSGLNAACAAIDVHLNRA